MKNINVAILGASDNPERYSYKALQLLTENSYPVVPVHPVLDEIEGHKVEKNLKNLKGKVHTLTLYVGPKNIAPMIDDIIAMNPERVILNPGTESEELKKALKEHGIHFVEACTLVLLRTGQFEKV
jgi:hypothetical protein